MASSTTSNVDLRTIAEIEDVAARIVPADAVGLRRATRLLRDGGVCAFPTETVYGLGGNALSPTAISTIYRMKGRPAWNPLIVHVRDAAEAKSLAGVWPTAAEELARRFWPGPLTMVVERADGLPRELGVGTETIALRVPAHPVALALLAECALPLAAPSANRSQCLSPTRAEHVLGSLPEVPLVLDGGPCRLGIESTVIDLTTSPPRLLRPGALPLRRICDVLGPVGVPALNVEDGAVSSPGMARRHYAPRAKAVIVEAPTPAIVREFTPPRGVLSCQPLDADVVNEVDRTEVLPDDPQGYAADLYAALHRLDDSQMSTVVIVAPPDHEDWLAVRDRLQRAAA